MTLCRLCSLSRLITLCESRRRFVVLVRLCRIELLGQPRGESPATYGLVKDVAALHLHANDTGPWVMRGAAVTCQECDVIHAQPG